MQVGKKGKGKHWTDSEVKARQEAADKLKRETTSPLAPPDWLSEPALIVWQRKLDEVAGLKASEDLLDVLDREMLAVFCDVTVQYQVVAQKKRKDADDMKDLQAFSRIIAQYADKLGFTPAARARLVKKIAGEKDKDTFGKKFD